MRLLGSALMSHLCDQKRRSTVTGLSDLKTLFIDLGCLYCKQTQRAFNVFKNKLNGLKIDSVDQKFYWLECGNFSQDAGTPGTERLIAFSQLAVKGLKWGPIHGWTFFGARIWPKKQLVGRPATWVRFLVGTASTHLNVHSSGVSMLRCRYSTIYRALFRYFSCLHSSLVTHLQ
jgi:hypothetical protein